MRVAGIGFNSRATGASIRDALAQAGGAEALATAETKAAALRGLAPGLPVRGIAPDDLARQPVLTRSARVAALHGTGSLAEAAALAAAGPGARLLGPRVTSADGRATAAIAEGRDE
ncbi:MAG: cobalamin biosynthesis protein [Cereibacter changlensis]|uniref:Cobalt-precorrin 5A hydrolase n=2 Tax=Cereibacter changlensis TaxID=402884 RepID=A0A2W7RHL5_9RHOB|nr:cobalamin biosynthesis protein [Cereibacter changlensis]PZX55067.1 cobalt-precorrin 5A hydrolase [Cereibacter changlensis]